MSDLLDDQIREALASMVAETPEAPPSPVRQMVPARARRRWVVAVATALAILVVGIGSVLVLNRLTGPAEVEPAAPGTEEASTTTVGPRVESTGFFVADTAPDEYVLFEASAHIRQGGTVTYVRDTGEVPWRPGDGGFRVTSLPRLLNRQADAGPQDGRVGAERVMEGARALQDVEELRIGSWPALLRESSLTQGGGQITHWSLLVHDGAGGMFEVSAVGMTRDEVLSVAQGVRMASFAELEVAAWSVSWTHQAFVPHDEFAYVIPDVISEVGRDVRVALGTDLLAPRLAYTAGEPGPPALESTVGIVTFTVKDGLEDGTVAALVSEDPGVLGLTLSAKSEQRYIDRFVEAMNQGAVLSDVPRVVQAPPGPEPAFDPSTLGQEAPLVALESMDVALDTMLASGEESFAVEPAIATADRPIVAVGTLDPPGNLSQTSYLIWFTEPDDVCEAVVWPTGSGSGCGGPVAGTSYGATGSGSEGGQTTISYSVPPETSVVQFVTRDGDYWQRPNTGHGLFSWGRDVLRPTEMVAYAADGSELGRWKIDPGF